MDAQGGSYNLTEPAKFPSVANMIFQNKTLILVTKQQQHYSSSQQMALLAGMAFVGGIVAGLLIRCIYYGIVKFFVNSVDQLVSQQQQQQGNATVSCVDDNFRVANDEPPDYVTVVTSTNGFLPRGGLSRKDLVELKVGEDAPPPAYLSIVSGFGRVMRSMST